MSNEEMLNTFYCLPLPRHILYHRSRYGGSHRIVRNVAGHVAPPPPPRYHAKEEELDRRRQQYAAWARLGQQLMPHHTTHRHQARPPPASPSSSHTVRRTRHVSHHNTRCHRAPIYTVTNNIINIHKNKESPSVDTSVIISHAIEEWHCHIRSTMLTTYQARHRHTPSATNG